MHLCNSFTQHNNVRRPGESHRGAGRKKNENPVRPSKRLKRGWILLFDASTWSSGKAEADGAQHTLSSG